MQENKEQKTAKRLFLLGEEPNGERFVITEQTAVGTGVEIVQRPLSQHNASTDSQDITSPGWRFTPETAHNGLGSLYN